MTPFLMGAAGGSCSGKTTLLKSLHERLDPGTSTILAQDNYYRDQSADFDHDGGAINFDHPDAIDFELLATHLQQLKAGHAIAVPQYDFATHSRRAETVRLEPHPLIFIDGLLILSQPPILELLDHSVFIECDTEQRLQRRIRRDVAERGRTREGVLAQFSEQVAPMHDQFIEPSKSKATLILNQKECGEEISGASERLLQLCRKQLTSAP